MFNLSAYAAAYGEDGTCDKCIVFLFKWTDSNMANFHFKPNVWCECFGFICNLPINIRFVAYYVICSAISRPSLLGRLEICFAYYHCRCIQLLALLLSTLHFGKIDTLIMATISGCRQFEWVLYCVHVCTISASSGYACKYVLYFILFSNNLDVASISTFIDTSTELVSMFPLQYCHLHQIIDIDKTIFPFHVRFAYRFLSECGAFALFYSRIWPIGLRKS